MITAFCSYGQGVQSKEEFLEEIWSITLPKCKDKCNLYFNCGPTSITANLLYTSKVKRKVPAKVLNELYAHSKNDTFSLQWDFSKIPFAKSITWDSAIKSTSSGRFNAIWYEFSRPIYSNNGDYAIISMSFTCGPLCGQGFTYLLKKVKGRGWVKIAMLDFWIS